MAPMHLAGFAEVHDAAAVFSNVAALADDRLFTQGDDLRVPTLNQVILAAAGADGVVAPRARLVSPTLDELVRYEISPINITNALPVEPDTPQAIDDLRMSPLVLGVDELLNAQLNNNPGAAEEQWILLWFADSPPNPVSAGRGFTVRATGTTTLGVIIWTSVTITLDENLPPGNYQIIGLRVESPACIAGRIILRTGDFQRPGALGTDLISDLAFPPFRHGGLGVWGEFPFTQLPAVEFLAGVADTAQTVHLDLIRIGR